MKSTTSIARGWNLPGWRLLGLLAVLALGYYLGTFRQPSEQPAYGESTEELAPERLKAFERAADWNEEGAGDTYLRQSPAAVADREPSDWGLGDNHVSNLKPYPPSEPGTRTPFDLYRYAGQGAS